MKKTTKIVCSIILVCVLLGCIIGLIKTSKLPNKILNEAVFLDNAEIKPENDGKLVVAKAIIKCENDITDDTFGVSVKSPYLNRIVETKQFVKDTSGKILEKYQTYEATKIIDDKKNPELVISGDTFTQDVTFGDFTIEGKLLSKFESNSKVSNFSTANMKEPYYYLYFSTDTNRYTTTKPSVFNDSVIKLIFTDSTRDKVLKYSYSKTDLIGEKVEFTNREGKYTTQNTDVSLIGDVRLEFNYLDTDQLGEITIIAKQEGNSFKEYKENGLNVFYMYEGDYSNTADLRKKLEKEATGNNLIIIGVLIIVIIIGIFIFRNDIKEKLLKYTKNKSKNNN